MRLPFKKERIKKSKFIFDKNKIKINRGGLATNPLQNFNFTGGSVFSPSSATNMVTNGDFSNGTTGWYPSNGITGLIALNNEVSFTATTQYGQLYTNLNIINNHKYYIRCLLKSDSTQVALYIQSYASAYSKGTNIYEKVSSIIVATSDGTINPMVFDVRVSGWTKIYFKEFIAIDLTATFGAGNEPTQAWCDANIPFFNGTQDVLSPSAKVTHGNSFFVGSDTATYEFDFSTKVAGSVAECPMKVYRNDTSDISTVLPTAGLEIIDQSEIDRLKVQDNNPYNTSINTIGKTKYIIVEVDLTPLCNVLYGGSNAALKSALKAFNVDVYASGSGSSAGVLTNGCAWKFWNGSTWDISGINIVDNPSTYASITKMSMSITDKTQLNNRVDSSNKLYIILYSVYFSDGTILSSVNLDYINIKINLARMEDMVQDIPINIPRKWGFIVKGFSPNWNKDNWNLANYGAIQFLKDVDNYISLLETSESSLKSIRTVVKLGASYPIDDKFNVGTLLNKFQVINKLVTYANNILTSYILLNNNTIIKHSYNIDLSVLTGSLKLKLTAKLNAFAESFTLLDLTKLGKSNGFSDGEALSILKGINHIKDLNIIKDKDFSNGTSLWSCLYSSNSVNNNILSNTGSGANSYCILMPHTSTMNDTITNGKKVYMRAIARVTNTVCTSLVLYADCSDTGAYMMLQTVNSPVKDQWYTLSGIGTYTNQTVNVLPRIDHTYTTAAASNGQVMQVSQFIAIDLTLLFGAGNEPTQAQMDDLFTKNSNNLANIINPELFDINAVTLHANATRSNGAITLNATAAWQESTLFIPVLPNNRYSINISTSTGFYGIDEYYNNIIVKSNTVYKSSAGETIFTIGSNCNNLKIRFTNDSAGTFTFSNISLRRKD